tara:strand:- start:52 stop:486 length:435 start_codon:yes stop_codon:yes gene_type:complete
VQIQAFGYLVENLSLSLYIIIIMNFKNLGLDTKILVLFYYIWSIFNPLYLVGFIAGYLMMVFEEKFLTGILQTNKETSSNTQTKPVSIYDPWPTTGVSKSVELENRIHNQYSQWWSTNDEDDLKVIYQLEEELEEFYRQNPQII